MSGHTPWSEVMRRQFPEVVNARFPSGTKARIRALADRTMVELAADESLSTHLLSPSVIVRRAVLEYLDREEAR